MYDCDKGFILGERGPPGATCVGGLWRPTELPSCLPGLHPRLRWNRRKRSLQIRTHRSQYLLRNYRQLQRKISELLDNVYNGPSAHHDLMRSKRNAFRERRFFPSWGPERYRYKRNILNNRLARLTRSGSSPPYHLQRARRNRNNDDQAFNRYYQLLKQNHIDYITAMFRVNQDLHRLNISENEMHHFGTLPNENARGRPGLASRKLHVAGNELFMNHENNQPHHFRDNYEPGNTHMRSDFNSMANVPIPFPNVNENLNSPHSKKLEISSPFVNNTYNDGQTWKFSRQNTVKGTRGPIRLSESSPSRLNTSDIIALLKSQIVRRKKRSTEEDSSSEAVSEIETRPGRRRKFNQTQYDGDESTDNGRKGKAKEPCEVCFFSNYYSNEFFFI